MVIVRKADFVISSCILNKGFLENFFMSICPWPANYSDKTNFSKKNLSTIKSFGSTMGTRNHIKTFENLRLFWLKPPPLKRFQRSCVQTLRTSALENYFFPNPYEADDIRTTYSQNTIYVQQKSCIFSIQQQAKAFTFLSC